MKSSLISVTTISLLWLLNTTNGQVEILQQIGGDVNSNFLLLNATFLIETLHTIQEKWNFTNFVLFLTNDENFHRDNEYRKLIKRIFEEFNEVDKLVLQAAGNVTSFNVLENGPNATNNEAEKLHLNSILNDETLCLVFAAGASDLVFELASVSLYDLRRLPTIFIYYPTSAGNNTKVILREIRQIFKWAWQQFFLRTALLTMQQNVFLLEPYPTPQVLNKTLDWHLSEFFIDHTNNFRGMVVDTPVRFDVPRVFEIYKIKHGARKRVISGFSGKLFTSFLQTVNATLIDSKAPELLTETVKLEKIFDLISSKRIEISLHSFTATNPQTEDKSYPLNLNPWCIMVPYQNPCPEYFLKQIFDNGLWCSLCAFVIYATFALWLNAREQQLECSFAFLQVLSIITYLSQPLNWTSTLRTRTIFILIFLIGFFCTNLYNSKLSSILTTEPEARQIDTAQDVIAANLRIKLALFEQINFKAFPHLFPARFFDQTDIMAYDELSIERQKMNTSFGYTINGDRWDLLRRQQELLNKPLFRISRMCMGTYHHVFPLVRNSQFRRRLRLFILYSRQYGFYEYWAKASFADALRMKYVKMLRPKDENQALSLRFFHMIFIVWWVGLIVSGLAFILEVQWHRWVRRHRSLRRQWRWSKRKLNWVSTNSSEMKFCLHSKTSSSQRAQ